LALGVFLIIGGVISVSTHIIQKSRRKALSQTATLGEQSSKLQVQASLLASAPIMIRRMDGQITAWSGSLEHLLGWTRDEAIGQSSHILLKTQFPCALPEIETVLLENGVWNGELTHTRRDGGKVVIASHWT